MGCGKSTVANLFADYGVPVIDADHIAHALVAKDQPALIEISQHFGKQVLNADGSLNRQMLSDIIFADSTQKNCLEKILHPLIYAGIQSQVDSLTYPYCMIAIPLLFETGMGHFVDRILVVDCPVELQISRIKARDHHSEGKINAIINSQISPALRRAKADDLIENSDEYKSLAEQVKKLHNLYLTYCKDKP